LKAGDGGTPLHLASFTGCFESVKHLVRHGASIESPGLTGKTALHLAAAKGHTRIANYFLRRGAAVDAKDADGVTPLISTALLGTVLEPFPPRS
jgi:ankyrin repeat protein